MQSGYVFKSGSSWYLRYRDNFTVDGKIERRQKCVKLTDYSDRYRSASDLDDLVAEKMGNVRQASKCPHSSESFINYVETVYFPFAQRSKKPSTVAGYRTYWQHYIKPRVTDYLLRDFTLAIVSSLLEDVASMHTLNKDTVGKIRSVLSGIFSYAICKGAFPARSKADNPASLALIPDLATEPEETIAASRDEVTAYLAHLDEQGMMLERAAVALVAFTGIRPGEARGLRWEEWNRTKSQIQVVRSVWHAIEGTTKTKQSNRMVTVTDELRTILTALWDSQRCPISGYILARSDGGCCNLDNMSRRNIRPALSRCAVCKQLESDKHKGHAFERDESLPRWHGWYGLRRFHGTQVREHSDNSDTMAKALGNSKAVADKHYLKTVEVLPDVRKAVNDAMRGLVH